MPGKEYTQTKRLKKKLLQLGFDRSDFKVRTEVDYDKGKIGEAVAKFKKTEVKEGEALRKVPKMATRNMYVVVMDYGHGPIVYKVTSKYVKDKKPIKVTTEDFTRRMNREEFKKWMSRQKSGSITENIL